MSLVVIERAKHDPQSPYGKIAAELRRSILSGALVDGDFAPAEKQLAATHQVVIGTARRAMELLKTWGFITLSRGRRAIIVRTSELLESSSDSDLSSAVVREHAVPNPVVSPGIASGDGDHSGDMGERLWLITLRGPGGHRYPARRVCADLSRPNSFWAHFLAIVRIERSTGTDRGDDWIGDYELGIREPGKQHMDPVLTLCWQPN